MYKHGASCVLDMFDGNTSIWMDIDINVVGFLYFEIEKNTFEQIVFEMEEVLAQYFARVTSAARLQE